DGRGFASKAIDRLELLDRLDHRHCRPLPFGGLFAKPASPDDLRQLACVEFGATDIHDRHVRLLVRRNRALKAMLQRAVARPPAHREAPCEHIRWRRDRNDHNLGIAASHWLDDYAGYIGHDRASGTDIVIDSARQTVEMTVRLPMHREFTAL